MNKVYFNKYKSDLAYRSHNIHHIMCYIYLYQRHMSPRLHFFSTPLYFSLQYCIIIIVIGMSSILMPIYIKSSSPWTINKDITQLELSCFIFPCSKVTIYVSTLQTKGESESSIGDNTYHLYHFSFFSPTKGLFSFSHIIFPHL